MDIGTSRLALRSRNMWEAADMGVRLWAERKALYTALWLSYSLPLVLLLLLLFWQSPGWGAFVLWWLKPVFEAPVLKILSQQVFAEPPGYRACVAAGWRALRRKRLLGDLLLPWRRLTWMRSFTLPIVVLEGLDGAAYRMRRDELSRHGGGVAGWLTVFGIHFEGIFTYGLIIIAYWLWMGNPVQDALVQPMTYRQTWEVWAAIQDALFYDDGLWLGRVYLLLYGLTLSLWGPVYVAAGFGVYLQARTVSEAWDVRLGARRLAARLRATAPLLAALCCALALWQAPAPLQAETLPDQGQVAEVRRQVLEQKPFPYVERDKAYCWKSCEQTSSGSLEPPVNVAGGGALLQLLGWGLLAVLAAALLWLLWRHVGLEGSGREGKAQAEAPQTLFGLAITPESLPENVSDSVLALWPQDARAALGLLYRASLAQLPRRFDIPLKDSDTEGEILRRVDGSAAAADIGGYWHSLTAHWLRLAYAHRLPAAETVQDLCGQYRRRFEAGGGGR